MRHDLCPLVCSIWSHLAGPHSTLPAKWHRSHPKASNTYHSYFLFLRFPFLKGSSEKTAFFGQAAVRGERGQLPRPWPKANVRILNQNTLGWGVNSYTVSHGGKKSEVSKNEDIIDFKKSESSKISSYIGWFGRSSMRLHPTFARCHLQRASQLICWQSKDAK